MPAGHGHPTLQDPKPREQHVRDPELWLPSWAHRAGFWKSLPGRGSGHPPCGHHSPVMPGWGARAEPALVPLLAMKLAMSTSLPSMDKLRMQPTNCRLCTGKSSGRLGTPPRSRGPVRSRDLGRQSRHA